MSVRFVLLLFVLLAALPALGARSAGLERCRHLDDTGNAEADGCWLGLLEKSADESVRAEAYWALGNIQQANGAFRRAVEARPMDANLRARWGELFLVAHQAGDAEMLFAEALEIDPENVPALLGQAELLLDRFAPGAWPRIDQVLALDAGNPRARLMAARLRLESADRDGAADILLDLVTPNADVPLRARLDALALLAAADHLSGIASPDRPSPWTTQALELNPRFGDAYAVPAYFYVITRRYREAVALLEMAVAVEPDNWDARTDLGTNLLRLNRIDDGQAELRTAYEGDAFNAETVNTLRLLDTLSRFDRTTAEHLLLRTHPDETAVLAPYVIELVDKAAAEMAPRYGYTLERPVVLELYQHHDDFAVRTAGLPGIGILGATFGDVVVMDGPGAKPATEWDWPSAVWHEIAHVITLNTTDNRVARWFSEGVSVHEEQRYGPSPNASVPLDFLAAMARGRLLPVAELDNGFMRPQYENQIGVSYVQAGLLCSFIADTYEQGLVRLLRAYATTSDTVVAIQEGLGMDPEDLDAAFLEHLDARYGHAAAHLADYQAKNQVAARALKAQRWQEARTAAEAAIALYPDFAGSGNPRLKLARALEVTGNPDDLVLARETLMDYFEIGGRDPVALARAVALYDAAGAMTDAYRIQHTLARLDPLDGEQHARLGTLAAALDHPEEALTEYRLALALDPHDKARAHYQVAAALHSLGRTDEATRELLLALEIAPRYPEGLQLLREISQ